MAVQPIDNSKRSDLTVPVVGAAGLTGGAVGYFGVRENATVESLTSQKKLPFLKSGYEEVDKFIKQNGDKLSPEQKTAANTIAEAMEADKSVDESLKKLFKDSKEVKIADYLCLCGDDSIQDHIENQLESNKMEIKSIEDFEKLFDKEKFIAENITKIEAQINELNKSDPADKKIIAQIKTKLGFDLSSINNETREWGTGVLNEQLAANRTALANYEKEIKFLKETNAVKDCRIPLGVLKERLLLNDGNTLVRDLGTSLEALNKGEIKLKMPSLKNAAKFAAFFGAGALILNWLLGSGNKEAEAA